MGLNLAENLRDDFVFSLATIDVEKFDIMAGGKTSLGFDNGFQKPGGNDNDRPAIWVWVGEVSGEQMEQVVGRKV
jgi:hypothetical protein